MMLQLQFNDRVALSSCNRRVYFLENIQARNDVGAAFNKPSLNNASYSVVVDLSKHRGIYSLGMGAVQDSTFYTCRQFKDPLTIEKLKWGGCRNCAN